MPGSTSKVYQSSFSKYNYFFSVNIIQIYLWFNNIFCMSVIYVQPVHIYFNMKMANITYNGFILHSTEMLLGYKITATGSCNNNICFFYCIYHFLYLKSIHGSL